MLLAGDSLGKSQLGNNNAYCQDNPLAWLEWDSPRDPALHDFVSALLALRRKHDAFRRETYFTGEPIAGGTRKDVTWLRPDGREMVEADWHDRGRRVLGLLFGSGPDAALEPLFCLFLNAASHGEALELPANHGGWELLVDTAGSPETDVGAPLPTDGTHALAGRALALFRSTPEPMP